MGILNVTPDSFSDGGHYQSIDDAVNKAIEMINEGAHIIDVGGESTRPGSLGVGADEECSRVIPVIKGIRVRSDVEVSIDTTKPEVARAAVNAGAGWINDVSMLRNSVELAVVAKEAKAKLILMHSRKAPADMQTDISYDNVIEDVSKELLESVDRAMGVGLDKGNIWLDPGIGFAKTPAQNLELMTNLQMIVNLGFPVLVGPSRKSFINAYCKSQTNDRIGGTAAAVGICVFNGALGIRVHDVSIMGQAAVIAYEMATKMINGKTNA